MAHKEKMNAQSKAYREAHREELIAYSRAYREANKEACIARDNQYCLDHMEERKALLKSIQKRKRSN